MREDLTIPQTVEGLLATVDAELSRLSTQEPWGHLSPFLMQLPGCANELASRIAHFKRQ